MLTPASSYAASAPGADKVVASAPSVVAKKGKTWHRKLAVGHGKRKVKVFTCRTGSTDNYLAHFKVTTRRSSDRNPPRIRVTATNGGHDSNTEFSLFPGGLTKKWTDGYWAADAAFKVKVRNQGKSKKKTIAVSRFGAC